jgi:hypothetical protein
MPAKVTIGVIVVVSCIWSFLVISMMLCDWKVNDFCGGLFDVYKSIVTDGDTF